MGLCGKAKYHEFLQTRVEFECMWVRSGIILVKYWFSVSGEEQERRFRLIPYEDLTPKPLKLPPLEKTKYIRPPIRDQNLHARCVPISLANL